MEVAQLGLRVNIDGLEEVREATQALNALAAAADRAEKALARVGAPVEVTVSASHMAAVVDQQDRLRG